MTKKESSPEVLYYIIDRTNIGAMDFEDKTLHRLMKGFSKEAGEAGMTALDLPSCLHKLKASVWSGEVFVVLAKTSGGVCVSCMPLRVARSFFNDDLEVTELFWYTPKEFRGLGVSRPMIDAAKAYCFKVVKAKRLFLASINRGEVDYAKFYGKHGFKEIQRFYYFDPSEQVISKAS